MNLNLTFVAPGWWNTDLNEYEGPSSSVICALMAELDAVKLVWEALQRFPDGAKNAFSPGKLTKRAQSKKDSNAAVTPTEVMINSLKFQKMRYCVKWRG